MRDSTASPAAKPGPETPTATQPGISKPDASKQPDKAKKSITPGNWIKIGIAVFVVVILALYLLRNVLLGTPTKVYAATSGELVQSVVASGRVISPQRVTVALQGSGRVLRVAVA